MVTCFLSVGPSGLWLPPVTPGPPMFALRLSNHNPCSLHHQHAVSMCPMKSLIDSFTSSSQFPWPPSNQCPYWSLVEGKSNPNLKVGRPSAGFSHPTLASVQAWIDPSQLSFSASENHFGPFLPLMQNLPAHPINPTSYFSRFSFLQNSSPTKPACGQSSERTFSLHLRK